MKPQINESYSYEFKTLNLTVYYFSLWNFRLLNLHYELQLHENFILKTFLWNLWNLPVLMQISEILKTLQEQIFQILWRRQGSLDNVVKMLRTYFLISRKLDYAHGINLIKTLEVILLLIIMSIVTSNFYKYISLALLLITFSLVIYIIITEFLRLKSIHEDLKLACSFPPEESS